MPARLPDNSLAADIDRAEVNATQALDRAATEVRETRAFLQSLTRNHELATQLQDAPTLLEQTRQRFHEIESELTDSIDAWKASTALLRDAVEEVRQAQETMATLGRIYDVVPKLDRIDHVIDMLDRAEVITWRH